MASISPDMLLCSPLRGALYDHCQVGQRSRRICKDAQQMDSAVEIGVCNRPSSIQGDVDKAGS